MLLNVFFLFEAIQGALYDGVIPYCIGTINLTILTWGRLPKLAAAYDDQRGGRRTHFVRLGKHAHNSTYIQLQTTPAVKD